jgi:hypothetical protein
MPYLIPLQLRKTKAGRVIYVGVLAALCVCAVAPQAICQDIPSPTPDDSLVVEIINSVVRVFQDTTPPVWPGYDLSTQTTLFYVPARWAVLLNQKTPVPGYTTYPGNWPDLHAQALFRWGAIEELTGQLYFDYPLDTMKTVAVPIYTKVPDEYGPVRLAMFAFAVHEAFHQFQRTVFQDMESFSEEKYPILDVENNALIALEMLLLRDVVHHMRLDDASEVRHLASMFVAVREYRWRRTIPIVRELERAKELQEGSAKYVETRYVGIMADLCRSGSPPPGGTCEYFSPLTMTTYLEEDFDNRMKNNALSPEDIPRYRIYPMGASMCLLLDYLGVPWKGLVEKGEPRFTLAGLLRESLALSDSSTSGLLDEAKGRYGFDAITAESRSLIEDYLRGFEAGLSAFEAQPGVRVEVAVPTNGLSRSRSSRGTRWTMDGGDRVLGEHYIVYTLRRGNPDFFLNVENTGVLEERVGESRKRVSFRVPALTEAKVDGSAVSLGTPGRYPFRDLILTGDGLRITSKAEGTLTIGADTATISIESP